MEEKAEIAYGYKERKFWNWSTKVLGLMKEPNETTAALL